MTTTLNNHTQPLDIWISEYLIIPDARPCPLLMHLSEPDTNPQTLFWNPLREVLPGLVRVHKFKDIKDAGDLVVIPHEAKEWAIQKRLPELRKFIKRVLSSGRLVVTFAGGMEYTPLNNEIVFAASSYDYPSETVIPIPNWLYDIGSRITRIQKPKQASVAFDGNTTYPSKLNSLTKNIKLPEKLIFRMALSRRLGRSIDLSYRFITARYFRQCILKYVRESANLKSHLVERGNLFTFTKEYIIRARAEYLQAIQEHPYILCMRGDANGDFRTLEVLSAGRIPIIIDTKFRLPELQGLCWKDFALFISLNEVANIGEIINQFHNQLTEEAFQQKCQMARQAFDQLMPHRFIHHLISQIKSRMPVKTSTLLLNDIERVGGPALTETEYQKPAAR